MKPFRLLAVLALLCLGLAPSSFAKERIKGTNLIKPGASNKEIYLALISVPITEGEVSLFLGSVDEVIDWAQSHKKEWNEANTATDTVNAFAALPVWKEVDLSSKEFLAMLLKLLIARELSSPDVNTANLRRNLKAVKDKLDDPNLSTEKRRELLIAGIALAKLINDIENYPEANKRIYTTNKAKIDAVLDKVMELEENKAGGAKKQRRR